MNAVIKTISLALILLSSHGSSAAEMSNQDKQLLMNELMENILAYYVFKDQAVVIVEGLKELAKTEQFENTNDSQRLAMLLSDNLDEYDNHFNVTWRDPSLVEPDEPVQESWESMTKRNNFGFRSVNHLAGNVGFMDLRFFDGSEDAKKKVDSTVEQFKDSQAIIIDLRQNRGGDPGLVQYFSSYFFDPKKKVHLNSLYWREGNNTTDFFTLTDLPAAYLTDIPLYILTSPRTASAAEEFSYNMKHLNRATLIGESTIGGANPGRPVELSNHYSVFISTGAAINPVTKTNWEKVGVKPDVEVDAIDAFDVAYIKALESIRDSSENHWQRKEIKWQLETLKAEKNPRFTSQKILKAVVGTYGNRLITLSNGNLYYRNGKRMKQRMVSLQDNLFTLADDHAVRLSFERQKSKRELLVVEMVDGAKFTFDKNK